MKDVLFEIGLEEMPARFMNEAEQQLKEKTEAWLKEERIAYKRVTAYQSPRRLAVLISEIAPEQATIEEEMKGPAAKIAKDEAGNWTKAAIGFTKGQGASTEDLYTKEIKGVSYLFVKKRVEGRPTRDVLPAFKEIITHMQFGKNMRWGSETLRYARPIRWLVALYGQDVIPFEIAQVTTSNVTFGHRFLGGEVKIAEPGDYENLLRGQYVIPVFSERRDLIIEQIKVIEQEHGCSVPIDEALLEEVTNLVEYPTAFIGSFADGYLEIPDEVLITSMKEHQRYFPVLSEDGKLLPRFIAVRNGDSAHIDTVKKGNEKVLNARLSDARFFYEEDRKGSIRTYMDKLERVVFQEKLGTYHAKAKRVANLAKKIAELAGLDSDAAAKTEHAAYISKFDLVTNMVGEFTELEGIMGEKYALHFGEEPDVAQAIREHYLPVQANGDLPASDIGAAVAIADKLDTISGTIAAGLIPSGSQDPYGLRRQAAGILRILEDRNWDAAVETLIASALDILYAEVAGLSDQAKASEEVGQFIRQRAFYLLREQNIEQDVIQAVAGLEIGIFSYAVKKAAVLAQKRQDPEFKQVEEALVRVLNIAKSDPGHAVEPEWFATESEKALYEQAQTAEKEFVRYQHAKEEHKALEVLASLAPAIEQFFDNNMVMADDEKLKQNRLALLWHVAGLIRSYADLSAIEWKQQF